MSAPRFTVRIEAKIDGRQAAAYENDVESLGLLQSIVDSMQDAIERTIKAHDKASEDPTTRGDRK